MIRPAILISFLFATLTCAHGQWTLQEAHTTADLRGIHSLGNGVAWASGTGGTVLRTTNDGKDWHRCATPVDAEKLDFRGIQAFDENTAIVMSSGAGDQSRLYKTTDGCQSWKLLLTNPDKEGFWDAISINAPSQDALGKPLDHSHAWGYLLGGDPVNGIFTLFSTNDGGDTWSRIIASNRGPKGEGCKIDAFAARHDEAIFAASNGSLISFSGSYLIFVTGGSFSRMGYTDIFSLDGALCHLSAHLRTLPLAHGNASSGAFAVAAYPRLPSGANFPDKVMIVGGDYKLPNATSHNAVFGTRAGTFMQTFREPITPPHGYRSAVAYDELTKTWITVGPNGTDISTDDGRNWRSVTPTPQEAPDADKDWNALSLPFVVGPKGRLGKLNPKALTP